MNKLLVICGPTATGKTTLAAKFARIFNGELISADSRQVYRGMDICTGKDRPDVPIWLYDVVNPDEEFSVSHWVKLANAAIVDIVSRGKLPIVVGGTGLYINALIHPFETIDIPPNASLRKKLSALSVTQLQEMIPRGEMNASDWNNPRRLIRKIEITKTKIVIPKQSDVFDYLIIGLTAPLSKLDQLIDKRLESRLCAGLTEETALLLTRFDHSLPSMSAIGLNEHAYARRQLTWFNKQKGIHWFDVTDEKMPDKVTTLIDAWYTTHSHV